MKGPLLVKKMARNCLETQQSQNLINGKIEKFAESSINGLNLSDIIQRL